jgi:transcriptional regulator with XRE-family HTH domain
MPEFTVWLREQRKESGMSQPEVARAIGVHQTFISHLEHGRSQPSADTIQQLVNVFGAGFCFYPDEPEAPHDF